MRNLKQEMFSLIRNYFGYELTGTSCTPFLLNILVLFPSYCTLHKYLQGASQIQGTPVHYRMTYAGFRFPTSQFCLYGVFPLFSPWYFPSGYIIVHMFQGFPCGSAGKEPACQCCRCMQTRVQSLGQEDAWRGKLQPAPVFLPGNSHGQSYSPWGCSAYHRYKISGLIGSLTFTYQPRLASTGAPTHV